VVDREGPQRRRDEGGIWTVRRPGRDDGTVFTVITERFARANGKHMRAADGRPFVFAGDWRVVMTDGYFLGDGPRDDVITCCGHRLGSMEIESATLVSHSAVARSRRGGLATRRSQGNGKSFASVTLQTAQRR